ncbi:hypothetical protein SF83666_c11370 [Sinorhizobium fredii CCBAU 83666]|nr:hypothetical protein SF83666_c11370 [Sinorhizobium fredii CCBAU 83666]
MGRSAMRTFYAWMTDLSLWDGAGKPYSFHFFHVHLQQLGEKVHGPLPMCGP